MLTKFKNDPVLFISGILALISCIFVLPDMEYIGYINLRVLAILFALMLVVASLSNIGFFDFLTSRMLHIVKNQRQAAQILVMLAFFLSMFMTNDVTLVTLVPFALITVGRFGDHKGMMYTLILMTCAANLGSMMTPIGNPQNLYLYAQYDMSALHFLKLMLPYTLLSLLLLLISTFILVGKGSEVEPVREKFSPNMLKLVISFVLFAVAILSVLGVLHYLIMLALVLVVIFFMDPKIFAKADYSLLLTFVFFFILIGNLGRLDVVYNAMSAVVSRAPVLTAILASQVISNVPAAMLLSAFTDNGDALVIGTNLGGLGTLIASMASLITYKIYIRENKDGGSYIVAFSVVNVVMLVILIGAYYIMP